jgi:hypothetical protein
MTVEELIEQLNKLPPKATVFMLDKPVTEVFEELGGKKVHISKETE